MSTKGKDHLGITDKKILEMRGIVKVFPGVTALDRVDFTLQRGEIHALMGENGAGKSTLIKVLTGVYKFEEGVMLLDGSPIAPTSPQDAQNLGISTVYQEINLIPNLSVAENIFLGRQPKRFGRIDWKTIRCRAEESLRRLDLHIDVTQPLSSYSVAYQQMASIARALDVRAKILVLDEPTSSLDAAEVERLFTVMRKLKSEGLGILFVTHFIDQVYAVSDRITILRNGGRVGEYQTANLPQIDLIARMIGKEMDEVARMTSTIPASIEMTDREPFLHAEGIGRRGSLFPLDIEARSHEAHGLAGLLGSGRTELARILFGIDPTDSGSYKIDGRRTRIRSPRVAIQKGLGFCPEDRKTEGIIPNLSIRENIVIALQAKRGWIRRLGRGRQRAIAERFIRALGIATPDAEKPIVHLSGGNQQKAILARWLALEPRLLILDEPTRGIDVGAKVEVEKLIRSLCAEGMSILLISSELDEVARNSHRVLVLRDRRCAGELVGSEVDLSAIMRLIAQGEKE